MPLKFKFLTLSQSNPLNVVLGTVHAILGASVDFHQGSYADKSNLQILVCAVKKTDVSHVIALHRRCQFRIIIS